MIFSVNSGERICNIYLHEGKEFERKQYDSNDKYLFSNGELKLR